jgi:hypothetical protein
VGQLEPVRVIGTGTGHRNWFGSAGTGSCQWKTVHVSGNRVALAGTSSGSGNRFGSTETGSSQRDSSLGERNNFSGQKEPLRVSGNRFDLAGTGSG